MDDPTQHEVVAGLTARCRFPPAGTAVTCAVSGGADSSALLVLAVAAGCDATAVHVDHGLRKGSRAEAAVVEQLARRVGAGFRSEVVEVPHGPDLEARARNARRSVLPPGTLFGHTADDQAETVLVRLLRGTGPTGLAAMRSAGHPLLGLRRSETRGLCLALGIEVVDDPSNRDPRFVRNRVRTELLPLLDDIAGRDVVPLLVRLAGQAADQADLIGHLAASLDPRDASAVAAAPQPVAAAALRGWWAEATGLDHPPDAAAVARMSAVARGERVGCEVSAGWSLRRRQGRLRLVAPDERGDVLRRNVGGP